MALILRDFFSFAPTAGRAGSSSSDPDIREAAQGGKGLKVTFVASHAGMVNGNNVMYSPKGMKDCSYTWVWPQRRAIQVHHDDHADPIGRVIGSRYSGYGDTETSDAMRDAISVLRDGPSKETVVDLAKTLEDLNVLNDMKWRGVGELILDGIITDSAAIEKVLDGRYQGVSITQLPQHAFCSLCGHDWAVDGRCEHERGEVDEESGRKMYLVVGDTQYDEISYVNRPADPHAMTLNAQPINNFENPLQSDKKTDGSGMLLDRSMQTTISFQLIDSINEETIMALESDTKTKDEKPKVEDLDSLEPKEGDIKDSVLPTDLPAKDPNGSEEDSEDTEPKETNSPKATIEEALKCLFEDKENLTDDMSDVIFDALEAMVKEDTRLSLEERKSLPASSFCGSNKCLPVNDAAHYTAVKELINTYKGEGDKSELLSHVESKGLALGCSNTDGQDSEPQVAGLAADFDCSTFTDEELSGLLLDTEKVMADRGLKAKRQCDTCDELSIKVEKYKTSVPKLEDTVNILREEWKLVTGEHTASEDAHAKTLSDFQEILQDLAIKTLLLTDKDSTEEDLKVKVEAMTLDELKKITKENDLSEVISFVRSGQSREPNTTVTPSDADPEEITDENPIKKLSESLVNLNKEHGADFAARCMIDWMRAGKLPEDFTLDKAFELVAK